MARVAIPLARQVTACAFGGERLDQLFITTASCGIPAEELAEGQPNANAGTLFRIDFSATDVRGVPAPRFAGGAKA